MSSVKQNQDKHTTKNAAYDGILKYTGMFGGVQGIVSLITLFRVSIVSHLLGPTGAGFNDVYNRSTDLGKKVSDLGISYSAVQAISERDGKHNTEGDMTYAIEVVRSWSLWLALSGTLLFFLLAPLLSRWGFDGDLSYTPMFRWLSLTIGCSVLMGGELAVLKGGRRLVRLAWNQLAGAVTVLFVSIPCYYFWGIKGIVPSLLVSAIALLTVTCYHSFKAFTYRVTLFSNRIFRDGVYIIRQGFNYTLAGFLNSGTYYLISIYIFNQGNASEAGCYSYGMLFISYLSMLTFAVLENDFFPRLSSANKDRVLSTRIVNSQIEMLVVLITPIIVCFAILLPLVTRLLLDAKFMPLVEMTQIGVVGLFFRAMMHPPAYLSLSKGESRIFLLQEVVSYTFMGIAMIGGFKLLGLNGLGVGLLLSNIFDWLSIWLITKLCYDFVYSHRVWHLLRTQLPILVGMLAICMYTKGGAYITLGCAIMALSTLYSFRFLHRNTDIVHRIRRKIRKQKSSNPE